MKIELIKEIDKFKKIQATLFIFPNRKAAELFSAKNIDPFPK